MLFVRRISLPGTRPARAVATLVLVCLLLCVSGEAKAASAYLNGMSTSGGNPSKAYLTETTSVPTKKAASSIETSARAALPWRWHPIGGRSPRNLSSTGLGEKVPPYSVLGEETKKRLRESVYLTATYCPCCPAD